MVEMNRRQMLGLAASVAGAGLFAPSVLRASEPVKIRFANFAGPTAFLTNDIFRPAFDAIEKDADGSIKIEIYSGGSLAKPAETYDAVRKGIADMGWSITSYTPGRFKAATIVELPFEAPNSLAASKGLWALKEADLLDGFQGVKVISVMSSGIQQTHANFAVKEMKDFAGHRVRASGATASMMWEVFDAIPIALPASSIAESLSKNTLSGSMNDWVALDTWGILEFVKWHLDVSLGSAPCFLTMNQRFFDALPEPARKAFEKHSGPLFNDFWSKQIDGENARIREKIKTLADHTIIEPDAAQVASWKQQTAKVADKWAAENPNGARALEIYRQAVVG